MVTGVTVAVVIIAVQYLVPLVGEPRRTPASLRDHLRWSYLSRVLGSRSLAVLLSSRPFWDVFHRTVVNFSFRITVADRWMDPAQF